MKKIKIFAGASFWILVLLVLPRMKLKDAAPEIMAVYGSAQNVIDFLTVIGLIVVVLYVVKSLTPKASPVNLLARVGSDATKFYSFLFFIGFGDPMSFGSVEKTRFIGTEMTLFSDFGIFVKILLILLAFDIVLALLDFRGSRLADASGAQDPG